MTASGPCDIAIHHRPSSFSDRWVEYCRRHDVPFTLVDCYSTDIVQQVRGCKGLMWHWDQQDYKAVLFARQLTYSLEAMGLTVFPDSHTCWHFDDKIGQKYLLEAINAPLVPSYVFYEEQQALEWIAGATFPKVFKLRVGSGSSNVQLVRSRQHAYTLCARAFGSGFKPVASYFSDYTSKRSRVKSPALLATKLWRLPRSLLRIRAANKLMNRERGYVYFQDFLQDNLFDTRVIVTGDKAFGMRRYVRRNDFRASGSGLIDYSREVIDIRCVSNAFLLSDRLRTQSLACDYLFQENELRLIEISYGYVPRVYDKCVGYWDREMGWHEGPITGEDLIMEMFLERLGRRSE